MSASIKEVALKAGVSVATVSRVINGTGPVAAETRSRIQDAIDKLRYVPHGAARSLITNQTDTIGVLLPDLYGEFFSEVIRGIDLAARRNGYHVLVSGFHSDRSEIEAVLRAMRGRVDGLIVLSPDVDAQTLQRNLPDTLPVVLLNTPGTAAHLRLAFNIDNYGGAFAMVRHLAGLGHRRIALIRGPKENVDAQERLRGYHDALQPPVSRPARRIWSSKGTSARSRATGRAGACSSCSPRPDGRLRRQRLDGHRLPLRPARSAGCGSRTTSPSPDSTTSRSPAI